MKLKEVIGEKQPELANQKGIVFQQGIIRPQISLVTHRKLLKLGWEVILHPPCSPDLALSDYHLF